jgi:hypothetical protein
VHDARIGRFLSVDPLTPDYPHNSPYAFSEDVVINAVELEGLEKVEVNGQVSGSVTVGKNPQVRITATGTLGYTGDRSQFKADASLSVYKGGLGTSRMDNGTEFDISGNITGTIGSRELSTLLPQYTLNSETRSAIDNPFKFSGTYGKMFNYNSATSEVTSQGIVGFRIGAVGVSSSNDSPTLYKGGVPIRDGQVL